MCGLVRDKLSDLRCGERGFTLLEVLVVLVIIGVSLSLVTLNLEPSPAKVLDMEARRMVMYLENARDEAIYSGRPVWWSAQDDGLTFWKRDDGEWVKLEKDDFISEFKLEQKVKIESLDVDGISAKKGEVTPFFPAGFGPGFSAIIALKGRRAAITGDPIGNVRMEILK
ncbi:MAG: GspH/FimT family pseudopilin [Nitrospinota bacterium]|nr:GspH/FimT family pseudopilin [Nitrospinota bacterium]